MDKINMKVQTIDQYRVLKFINENFCPDRIKVQIYDENSLKVTDDEEQYIIFSCNGEGSEVVVKETSLQTD